jgi:hypothetical protein
VHSFESSAICMGACMHCILTSIFLQVMGPGLALNGPIGSMARAGMTLFCCGRCGSR